MTITPLEPRSKTSVTLPTVRLSQPLAIGITQLVTWISMRTALSSHSEVVTRPVLLCTLHVLMDIAGPDQSFLPLTSSYLTWFYNLAEAPKPPLLGPHSNVADSISVYIS